MFSKMATTFTIDTSEATVESLQTILTKTVTTKDTEQNYTILNYDANMVANNDNLRGLYNAVILDPETRRVMAIGPSQSITFDKFKSMNGTTVYNTNNLQVSELMEGVFVQFFYDPRTKAWDFSTRNSIGGHYTYYRSPAQVAKTYREMVYDAIGLEGESRSLSDWCALEIMDKQYCYHCILQHPENHMVQSHTKPGLYMIGAFELHFNGIENQIRYVSTKEYKSTFGMIQSKAQIHYPTVFPVEKNTTYDVIVHNLVTKNSPTTLMGIVIQQDNTGDRYIHINPNYETLQKLRGTHPNLMYQYLCLRKIHKMEEFLKHFPQYKAMFWKFRDIVEEFVVKLHQHYVDYFILKNKETIDKKLFYHIQQIHHTIYVPSLQEETKTIIRKNVVRKYIDELEPGHIFHLISTSSVSTSSA